MVIKDPKYVPIRDSNLITLGVLPVDDAIGAAGPIMVQDVFITRSDIVAHLRGMEAEFESLIFGIADGTFSDTEIEEHYGTNGPLHNRDNVSNEKARRRIQTIGIFGENEAHIAFDGNNPSGTITKIWSHNTRMGFTEDSGSWRWFLFNSGTLEITTGMSLRIFAKHHTRWM